MGMNISGVSNVESDERGTVSCSSCKDDGEVIQLLSANEHVKRHLLDTARVPGPR